MTLPTSNIPHTFADLGLDPQTLETLEAIGFTEPTPIQQRSIGSILMGRDILACAQTGSGKTASFILPLIDVLAHSRSRARMPRVLVLEPTRELAQQVASNVDLLSGERAVKHVTLVGGVNIGEQIQQLRKEVDIIISTPGRLIDLVERSVIVLNNIQAVVIDEADRMLDMGFIPDVRKILSFLPSSVQTLLFSATIPPEIRTMVQEFLREPKEIYVDSPSQASSTVRHIFVPVMSKSHRIDLLQDIVKRFMDDGGKQCVVFCNRKLDIPYARRAIAKVCVAVRELHGDMDQPSRTKALNLLRDGEIKILVCSDVAARGLDIADVDLVVNYDIPTTGDDYVHRVGRTGRAGRSGDALTLIPVDDFSTVTPLADVLKPQDAELDDQSSLFSQHNIATVEQLFNAATVAGKEERHGSSRNKLGRNRKTSKSASPSSQRISDDSQSRYQQNQQSEQPQRKERAITTKKRSHNDETSRPHGRRERYANTPSRSSSPEDNKAHEVNDQHEWPSFLLKPAQKKSSP